MKTNAETIHVADRRPELEVVRRQSRRLIRRAPGTRFAPMTVAVAIAAVAIIAGILLEQVALAQSAFKVWDLREQLATAEAEHEELLLESARLESPARVERFARRELGMVDPGAVEYIVAAIPGLGRGTRGDPDRTEVLPPSSPASAQGVAP